VNMIKEDGQVIHFNYPKVQASLAASTFAITGHLDTVSLNSLKKLASTVALVADLNKQACSENVDEASKHEDV
ncbi:unnamed protein product, partial [Candidula unifasciata]